MPENKYLWRASVRGVTRPIYLVAQNAASAAAAATAHPQVDPADLKNLQRLGLWNDQHGMTVMDWPEAPPEPDPDEPPP